MIPSLRQRTKRLGVRLEELRSWTVCAYHDLPEWTFDGAPILVGQPWPTRHGVVRIAHGPVQVPENWHLDDTVLDLNLGGESLVRIHYDDGGEEPFGHDPWHQRFPVRGRNFTVEAEAVARSPFGKPNREATLLRARIAAVDRTLERFVRQVALVIEAVDILGEAEVVPLLLDAAERAVNALQWPSETWQYVARVQDQPDMQNIWELPAGLDLHPRPLSEDERASVAAAREGLRAELQALQGRYPKVGSMLLSGHAHIDLAWLWPLDETRRKARRTFSTALSLLERYPEMRFNQSTAQLYAFIEEDDPALFARIQERVAAGQWEPVGGMWVEPDLNMPCGESLVRQLLYGQRYYQSRFGRIGTVSWLPDCFGFSPGLPQILRGAGIVDFFTIKLTWSETNQFPYDLFWWEGLDGSRVLAHTFDNPGFEGNNTNGYNADTGPHTLVETWQKYRGKYAFPESLLTVGYGDGGGGVTREMLEGARELDVFPAIPEGRWGLVRDFYDRMNEAAATHDLPVWYGELYLELHRGTLTTQSHTKYLHRRAERDLIAAEVLDALVHLAGGPEPAPAEDDWRLVLRNQFHDVLPGSGIGEVNAQAAAEFSRVVEHSMARIDAALQQLAATVVPAGETPTVIAVNPDLSPRPLRVQVQSPLPRGQQVADGYLFSSNTVVPGLGMVAAQEATGTSPLTVSTQHLENAYVRVTVAPDGTLSGVWDKRVEREVLAGPGNVIWAHVDKPRSWDAWDIDIGYGAAAEALTAVESIEVVEGGPHRVALRVVRRFRHSTIRQDIRLWANSPRIDFHTTIDWHDRRWMLKARFRPAVRSPRATFETAFGVHERPTHRNTSWDVARFEVAGHRFVDLSEPGYGVALLNDGKYGHDVHGNDIGLTLLRSPVYPDPLADEGEQTFTYALLPHPGTWLEGGVLMEAEDLNRPLIGQVLAAGGETTWTPLRITGLPLGLGALKPAEDGGSLIVRTYEPQGARGRAELALPEGWSAVEEVDLLERGGGAPEYDFTPFRIHSWRLTGQQ